MLHRISVVGTTGSGKTTLAHQVSRKLGISHIELDALYWEPNWTGASAEIFRTRLQIALQRKDWVTDGNYGTVRDIIWRRATTVVWLDYPYWLTFWRMFRRTIKRIITHELLWEHSHDTWRRQFMTKDSLFLWFFKSYHRRRREMPLLMQRPEFRHLYFIHLRHRSETEHWLTELA
jgi:adenylate kinase family enzyme